MSNLLKEYILGDMVARYVCDDKQELISLVLLPIQKPYLDDQDKNQAIDSLVQIKIVGDIYGSAYAQGNTLRNGETVKRLLYKNQRFVETEENTEIVTVLTDDRGYMVEHHLLWKKGDRFIRLYNEFFNQSEKTAKLEMISSFSLGEISPYLQGDGHNHMVVHRLRSSWSMEGRLESIPLEDLQLEPAWQPHGVKCERFGQVGSLPVNKFFPFLCVEDKKNQVFWGVQLAHGASWQMEIYRKDDGLSISGGLADREFGHWLKYIEPGENFQTPVAILSVCNTDSLDCFTSRLTDYAKEELNNGPVVEQDLPIIFNEYCTTWGCPSHENISAIVERIKNKGFTYFVIDCGWYKEEGVPWDISMGDYNISETLFPDGLEKTVEVIKNAGLKPGIWFEIENVGKASKAYQMEEHLLHRDGTVLTSEFRRFWNMKDSWVEQYLSEKVIGMIKQYGFEYLKIDYNDTIGIGCDGAESLGEGLRQNMEASIDFIKKIKMEIPQLIIENCASGGHRLEPGFMSRTQMASFSDAHECIEIPIIAANLHRVIQPAQSQIWAVIRKSDTPKRIAYSVANTFLGRMCISGDVTELSDVQWSFIDAGMAFYKKISRIIKTGQSYLYGTPITSTRYPEGWQGLVRVGDDTEAFIVLHTFGGTLPDKIEIALPDQISENISEVYSDTEIEVNIQNHRLTYIPRENFRAAAIYLK
jgi:Alpha-galactosidase